MPPFKDRWVARFRKRSGHRVTQFHFVESDVAERVVTKCGREMALKTEKGKLAGSDEVFTQKGVAVIDLCMPCQK